MPEKVVYESPLEPLYEKALNTEGTPPERFARVVLFHMVHGTRPPGDEHLGQWTTKKLADALNVTLKTIRNAQKGSVSANGEPRQFAFFGRNATKDTPRYAKWRSDFVALHSEARDFNLRGVRERKPRPVAKTPLQATSKRQFGNLRCLGDNETALHWFLDNSDGLKAVYNTVFSRSIDTYIVPEMEDYAKRIVEALKQGCLWHDIYGQDQEEEFGKFISRIPEEKTRANYQARLLPITLPLIQCLFMRYENKAVAVLVGWAFPGNAEGLVFLSQNEKTCAYFAKYVRGLFEQSHVPLVGANGFMHPKAHVIIARLKEGLQ